MESRWIQSIDLDTNCCSERVRVEVMARNEVAIRPRGTGAWGLYPKKRRA